MKPKFAKNKKKISAKTAYEEEIKRLKLQYDNLATEINNFQDLPLSEKTLKGLKDSKYLYPTEIQKKCIGPALQGKDLLAAAVTGSGKTLAFLIPVLEHLFMNKWSRSDGVCAIIISPTRELAYQIFETIKKVGKYHDFSAGLIIGGKNLAFERSRVDQCNIFICTPGRLLQHMDENPLFNVTTMEMLVLDEADRCLDMGFEQTLNAIIENFPPERQTLLFSATQTNSIKDLIRLNLKDPLYIGVAKEKVSLVVPDLLQQNYVVVPLEEKVKVLWSFIKNHLKHKIIVFLSTCKQTKYIYEIFCKLRPGTSLLAIYGTLHQDRRIAIYESFLRRSNVVLFATDVASRGLDFPSVNWVIQLDCPENVAQYIHRAGRSARNKTHGESLLVLTPNEENGMVEELQKQNIAIKKISIDPKKLFSPHAKIEAFLAQNSELKSSAQRAFVAYIKSVFLMKNKNIFNVKKIDLDSFAHSLGLVITPRIPFLQSIQRKNLATNAEEQKLNVFNFDNEGTKENRLKSEDTNSDSSSHSDSDDFLKIKRTNHELADEQDDLQLDMEDHGKKNKLVTKAAVAKKVLKKKIQVNAKRTFNDVGEEVKDPRKDLQSDLAKEYEKSSEGGIDLEMAKKLISEEDKYDKERFKEQVKLRHKLKKQKLKKANLEDQFSSEDEVEESSDQSEEELENSATDSEGSATEDIWEPIQKRAKMIKDLPLDDLENLATQILAKS